MKSSSLPKGSARWAAFLLGAALLSCGAPTKIDRIRSERIGASLALSRHEVEEERRVIESGSRDTITVTLDGREMILMHAIQDENGEMVASETLNAAIITARFRNVAERHGRIDLRFEVIVPAAMQDGRWQLRFYPDMYVLGDSTRLESVIVTGKDYRDAQLRGYERYNRFLRGIITDSSAFVDRRHLEIFIRRNIPELYRFRSDSSFVSEEEFTSFMGVTAEEALRHYTDRFALHRNEMKKARRGEFFSRYVKSPIFTEGVRVDTVLRGAGEDYVYPYTQSIRTRPGLRKVDIVLSGEIWEDDHLLYVMNRTEPLTFYISSLSSFVDGKERFLTRVVERRASAHTACYIDFEKGSSEINLDYAHNREETARIERNLRGLLENSTFDVDSIVIAASASPEGAAARNGALAARRARAIARHLDAFVAAYRDSLRRVSGREEDGAFALTVDENGRETLSRVEQSREETAPIPFRSLSSGENWELLTRLVDDDSTLSAAGRKRYHELLAVEGADEREALMQREEWYPHVREQLYPRVRTVRLDFHLHRKGMVKDTIHTTVPDTTYMRGVEALRERDYETALTLLRPYRDYNTAIAYVSLDYNASAMEILRGLPRSPQVDYMLALLHARAGDDAKAVEHYLAACREDRSYVFRGNLDPEIYVLIQRYRLNREDEDPDEGALH